MTLAVRDLFRFALNRALTPVLLFLAAGAHAQVPPPTAPSFSGQTGLLSMPDARMAPEGTWRSGMSYLKPYQAIWTSLTIMPFLEGSFRFTRTMYVPGFPGVPGTDYGDFKDKEFDLKLRVLPERGWWPQVALGVQDVQGTGVYSANYLAASKRLGEFDFTLGYGNNRIDGAFGGVRWSPASLPKWSLVAEYDAYNYAQDRRLGALRRGELQEERRRRPRIPLRLVGREGLRRARRGGRERLGVGAAAGKGIHPQD